jgi:predicted nucleic acid-binding protein
MIVIDTNFAISILVEDRSICTDVIENQHILAPFLIKMEILNVLRKYHFMRNIPIPDIDKIYRDSIELIDEFVPDHLLLDGAKKLSFKLNHHIIDCLFLSLAIQRDVPFVSFDKRLVAKAEKMGIKTMQV